jgi:GTPase SAR1 family protein
LGPSGFGKTSLSSRHMSHDFSEDQSMTGSIDFFTKLIQVRDRTVNCQMWDTTGQECFRSFIPFNIRDLSTTC